MAYPTAQATAQPWPVFPSVPPVGIPTMPPIAARCFLFGDPHITTFDGLQVDYYAPGEYWIVKSESVWIQGRYLATPYTAGKGCAKAIAIGGPFLRSSSGEARELIIRTEDASWEVPSRRKTTKILTGFPSVFHNDDPPVDITYSDPKRDTMQGDEGLCKKVVQASLPNGVKLHIERWIDRKNQSEQYMNLYLTMKPILGQDGHCGNFNGDPVDDTTEAVTARMGSRRVARTHLMFRYRTVAEIALVNGHSLEGYR